MIIDYINDSFPPHPGYILKCEIDEHGLSQRELAAAIGKSAPMVNGILNGSKDITVEIALLLEAALPGNMKASDWMRLQNDHDIEIKRAEVQRRTETIEKWNLLRNNSNFNAIKRRLKLGADFEENISLVMRAMGISTYSELEAKMRQIAKVGFKKSEKVTTDFPNLFSWIIIVKYVSGLQSVGINYNPDLLPELISKLNQVFFRNIRVVEKTGELLKQYGIKYISDEKRLDKVPVDGYSFWIGSNPTIVTTQRMNRIDNFAFTIMHELGHLYMHLTPNSSNEFIDVDHTIMQVNTQENEANAFATQALWSGDTPDEFFADIPNPYAAAKRLTYISKIKNMHIGIVTGQYQYFCERHRLVNNSYAICRDLISKIG